MSDEAYPTSDTRLRLKDMNEEQRKRYDAAIQARKDEKELSDLRRSRSAGVFNVPLSPLLYGLQKYGPAPDTRPRLNMSDDQLLSANMRKK